MTTQVSKPRLALFVDNVGAAELWPAIGTLAPVCAPGRRRHPSAIYRVPERAGGRNGMLLADPAAT